VWAGSGPEEIAKALVGFLGGLLGGIVAAGQGDTADEVGDVRGPSLFVPVELGRVALAADDYEHGAGDLVPSLQVLPVHLVVDRRSSQESSPATILRTVVA